MKIREIVDFISQDANHFWGSLAFLVVIFGGLEEVIKAFSGGCK